MLLQLHVLVPEPDDPQVDDIFDLVSTNGFFVPDDGKVTENRYFSTPPSVDAEFQTGLFEDRPDNLDRVEQVRDGLAQIFPDSTVFKYRVEETIGEFRSVADPDERIILYVGNSGLENPRIRWRQELNPYNVSSTVADNRVFHATHGSVFALDGDSGELQWDHEFSEIVSRPEARGEVVVAAGPWSLRALDATTGDQLWHIDFDEDEIEMIESRAEIGPEYVYIGTRSGDILAISKATGDWSVHHTFSNSVHELTDTQQGLLVNTSDGRTHALGDDGSIRWSTDTSLSFGPVHEGTLYGIKGRDGTQHNDIAAIALPDGTEHWTVEAKTTGPLSIADDTILAPTKDGILRLDCADGTVHWQNDTPVTSAAPVSPDIIGGIDDNSALQLLRLDTGKHVRTFSFGAEPEPPVQTQHGAVFVTGPELICLDSFN